MKSGFWRDFDERLKQKVNGASEEGQNPSKAAEYFVNKTIKEINGKKSEDEFYKKVCAMLDEFGEVSDAIGRLVDHDVYDNMNYEQKQRYTLELSNKYLEALEKYRKEKEFETSKK